MAKKIYLFVLVALSVLTASAWDGEGTESSPYLIKTKADLIELCTQTNVSLLTYDGVYFKMTADIDLEGDTQFTGIATTSSNNTKRFSATFDGDGHAIHGINIDAMEWKTAPTETSLGTPNGTKCTNNVGFIGYLGVKGTLKNLVIARDNKFVLFGYGAALVGRNYGTVTGCRNYANIIGYSSDIGGIVGQSEKGSVISDCLNAGYISTGFVENGGIVGKSSGIVERCINLGRVESSVISTFKASNKTGIVGGIVGSGYGALVRDVVNLGTVVAAYKAGGIVGSWEKPYKETTGTGYNDMYRAISAGTVLCDNHAQEGGIAGIDGTLGKTEDVYWDAQIAPLHAMALNAHENTTGVETSVLTSGTPLANYSADVWSFEAGKYPVLKEFAGDAEVAAARKVILSIPAGNSISDLKVNSTVSTDDGCKWALKQGTAFGLNGNTLVAPATVAKFTADTLVATVGNFEKQFRVTRFQANPLKGEGTAESPYLIGSVDDWNNLAEYIEETQTSLNGKYVKLAADIDFADKTFVPLYNGGVAEFQGTFLGNGKTLKNISFAATTVNQGAFRMIGAEGIVQDLTISGEITTKFACTGGFVGALKGTLKNCVNRANITSTNGGYVAGFVGQATGTARLENCVNYGNITAKNNYAAGIVAQAVADGVVYDHCVNEGTILNNGTASAQCVAGIVAYSKQAQFIECHNTGNILANDPTKVSALAGIAAQLFCEGESSPASYFKNCYNTANLEGKTVLAGILADVSTNTKKVMEGCYNTGNIRVMTTTKTNLLPSAGVSAYYIPGDSYTDCYNTGNVTADVCGEIAGVVGNFKTGANDTTAVVTIKRCYNTGDISAPFSVVGGIGGSLFDDVITIDSCYNTGNLSGLFMVGGIVASFRGPTNHVTNCWNSGTVTGANRVGGLIGCDNGQNRIDNCYNTGAVKTNSKDISDASSRETSYSIGGLAGEGSSAYTNCYNMGTVTGNNLTGGLIGNVSRLRPAKLINCYNGAKVECSLTQNYGNLIGVDADSTNTVIENTYFVTDYGTNAVGAAHGTGMTIKELAGSKVLGNAYSAPDAYSLPVLVARANDDFAKVYSASVVLADGDTFGKVTHAFNVGQPADVAWTASEAGTTFDGNDVRLPEGYSGELKLTATCGAASRSFNLTLANYTGVDGVVAADEVTGTAYYDVKGAFLGSKRPVAAGIYVVSETHRSGAVTTRKVVVR